MNFHSDLCFLSSSTPFPHIPFFFFLTYTRFFTVAHNQRCQLKSLPTGLPVGRKQKTNACWSRCPPADSLQKAFTEDFRFHCSVHFRSSSIFTWAKLYLESYDRKKMALLVRERTGEPRQARTDWGPGMETILTSMSGKGCTVRRFASRMALRYTESWRFFQDSHKTQDSWLEKDCPTEGKSIKDPWREKGFLYWVKCIDESHTDFCICLKKLE